MSENVKQISQAILANISENISCAASGQLPSLVLPAEYQHTSSGKLFLLYDSGPGEGMYEDPDFALNLRQLTALAFVPEEDIVTAYKELLDSNFYTENENLLLAVTNYFEDT
ncbi:hypothetical protein RN001_013306 [Aquatica leii]|uniref:Uncharacterized protein n=1 Tax=Aquatica leii TaxID=1421715 RepID=A0AAN7S6Y0_9COLE|nr:hypothetical protein RN001_013306 [Aquatica leii]